MNDRSKIEAMINEFYLALSSDDLSNLQLAENVVMTGVFVAEPIVGKADVIQHLRETSPFMRNIYSSRLIIENGAAVALTEFDVVNGVHIEGAYVFDVKDGQFIRLQSLFDTRSLFAKS